MKKKTIKWTATLCTISVVVALGLVYRAIHHPKSSVSKTLKNGEVDVSVLKSYYPVVSYHGPHKPFTIEIQKARPANWVSLSEVSEHAQKAIVISEDWAFYQHDGYDAQQIKEVLTKDLSKGKQIRGASTITQQVVKNIFLSSERSLWRKINELNLAIQLDRELSKNRILEIYLNIAEWGEGLFGIKSASEFYFAKTPSDLTAKEGAFLAMLLPSPKKYSQSFRKKELTPFAHKTVISILQKLVRAKILTPEQFEEEKERPLLFETPVESGETKNNGL